MKPEQLPLRRANGTRVHPATRWHRALGIASTLIVIITVVTGLVLNHGDALDLSRRHPHNAVIDKLYRQSAKALPKGFATERGWLAQLGAEIYLDTRPLATHEAPLVGALVWDDTLLVAYLAATLAEVYRGSGVSYERVLLDVHSGRLFGRVGVWVVDAAAVCLLALALTGTWMFFKFKRGGQRPPR
ncbi:MAG: PepSY domain-containing protein [Proteobacteria bacterium]|nr:PepSY domain-containing protein [Pseudomonadota bacterium]